MLRNFVSAIVGACVTLAHTAAPAQVADYPSKQIRIVVPFPPGGGTDIMMRNVSQKLGDAWQQPVVVENRAGGNGMIGADAVAKSQPDGYSYLAATIIHSAGVSLFPKAPYQLLKDLQPVAITGLIPVTVIVPADSPIRSLQDLLAASRSRNLNAGSPGNGSAAHLALELFKRATGARIEHIPYSGGAPVMVGLLGGQLDVSFALLPDCLAQVKSGKVRVLAVASGSRHPLLPDVPTSSEAGVTGTEVSSWNGLMVPAGTPTNIVLKINAEVTRITGAPDMRARIVELGFQPVVMSVRETENFVKADVQRWAKVIGEANIKVD